MLKGEKTTQVHGAQHIPLPVVQENLGMIFFWSIYVIILCLKKKANLRDLIAATGLVILIKLDSNHQFFFNHMTLKFDEWRRNIIGNLFYATSSK